MSEWKEVKLGDVAELIKDKYSPQKGDGLFYIGLEHIQEQSLRLNGIGCSDNITSNKFYFEEGDILFGKLRPYFRKVIIPKFSGVCSTDIWVVRSKNGVDQKYLFYLFANKEFVDLSNSGEAGTRMPRADWNFMSQSLWNIPNSKEEQKVIASVLSSLDDKIDLLHRQNETLEAMAETLFRQWFVEETDDGWEKTTLDQHIEVFRGISYKGSGLTERDFGLPMHNLNSVCEGGGYKYEGIKFYKGEYKEKHLINSRDIIVTNTEQGHEFKLIGFPAVVPDLFGNLGLFSQHIYKICPKKQTYLSREFIYYLLMTPLVREQIISATNGSTVNMLAIDGLQRPEFQLPPKETIIKFTRIIEGYWKKKDVNRKQVYTLEQLRDTLLPKLISGEVRVDYKDQRGSD
ncbi:restriction endonuclease subunit S [Desulfitibacter alkalitolerans]|uniref:restriction endonuclease subunit S n=1 Tax=Desulfitibacter alkalitolerans TaxID=264641 RepID=UPI000684F290|nr:restriction endonuclease subunit S [Desulfitibacter alkalitolerans]